MLIKLTHPEPNYDLYVDFNEVICIERYNRPQTILIRPEEKPIQTALVLKGGRIIACKETPEEIFAIVGRIEI